MQLVAYGAQDIYLTGNPQITFFKVVYRRHTNFSMETIQQTINGSSTIGTTSSSGTVTISRNGDLVSGVHIASSTLGIHHGDELIKDVELEIGGQKIDKHNKQWMQIWTELTTPKSKKEGVAFMTAAAGHPSASAAGLRGNAGVGTVIVPLQFWFCRNPGLALPLIALQYHEVKLKINWGISTDEIEAAAQCEVWADYVYLDTDERRRFAQVSHEYLIEQVQHQSNAAATSVKLNFNHPVKELIWTDEKSSYYDNCKIQLNGHDRFAKQPPEYFQLKQINDHHTSIPRLNYPSPDTHLQSTILKDGLLADVSEGLDGTAATTALEYNLFVTSDATYAAAGVGEFRYPDMLDSGADSMADSAPIDAIKAANFSAQSATTDASRFLAINATAAANPLHTASLSVGHSYDLHFHDANTGISHTTKHNVLIALYKRNGDATVGRNIGPIAKTAWNRSLTTVNEMAGTSVKAGMVVCEFEQDIFNGNALNGDGTAVALADGDTLRISNYYGDRVQRVKGATGTTSHGEATSLHDMINVYSFALKPEEHQPSGTCNFSRIDNAKMIFDTSPGSTINIYAVNYNVLRIMSGMGGLAYSN